MKEEIQNVVVICGPTASGKTGLALQLAKELSEANILSVDSRQVYKDLGVITGKDIPSDLPKSITIYGHNLFASDERANLADFVRYSKRIIQDSKETITPLIIVGGTGLYLKAITQDLSEVTIPPNQDLRNNLEKLNLKELQDFLQKENQQKHSSLNRSDFMNPRRLIRAIEISISNTGVSKTSTDKKDIIFHWVGLRPDKNALKTQIHNRVLERINQGAIKEVKKLLKKYPNRKLSIYSCLGVSQILDFLEKKITLDQLIELWTNAEADYARRQIVWFKKQPGIVWYDKDTDKSKLAKDLSKIYLKNA